MMKWKLEPEDGQKREARGQATGQSRLPLLLLYPGFSLSSAPQLLSPHCSVPEACGQCSEQAGRHA